MARDSSDPSSPSELDRRPVPLPQFIPQRDQIKIGTAGVSAFPNQSEPAFKLIPFCLWDSFRQPHILYYLLCSMPKRMQPLSSTSNFAMCKMGRK